MILTTKGKRTKSHADCPLIHNPTCQWRKAGGCRDGASCLFLQPSKKLIKSEEKKAETAAKAEGKPKAKAKPKGKAKAEK